jgi:hypothetical protein
MKTKLISVPMYSEGVRGDALVKVSVQCLSCKHIHKGYFTCAAFPKGIPDKIFTGKFDHQKQFPGDKGIRFEKK